MPKNPKTQSASDCTNK